MLPEITTSTLLIPALISILLGIAYCFFGYRIFRVLLAIAGFVAGALVGAAIVQQILTTQGVVEGNTLYLVLGALLGGGIGAVLMIFLYFIGIFSLGAAVGFALGLIVGTAIGAEPNMVLLIGGIAAVICGVLALILQRVVIIITTAISGAGNIVTGLALLVVPVGTIQRLLEAQDPTAVAPDLLADYAWMGVLWLVLAVAGMIVQFLWTGKKKPKPVVAAGMAMGTAAAGALPQVVVQQYNVAPPAQPVQAAPPIVFQAPPAAPPVIPTVIQPVPQAPAAFAAPEQAYVPPLPAPAEVQSFATPAAAGSKFCPQCGQPVAQGTAFCTHCGSSVAHLWQ